MRISLAVRLAAAVGLLAWVAGAPGRAGALTITSGCADAGQACTLEELFAGGSLVVDDVHFDAWRVDLLSTTGDVEPDLSRIEVRAGGTGELRFEAHGALRTTGEGSLRLGFSFHASPSGGAPLDYASLALEQYDFGTGEGLVYVDEFLYAGSSLATANSVLADAEFGFVWLEDEAGFEPTGGVGVATRLYLAGGGTSLGAFSQGFRSGGPALPSPEPGAPVLFAVNLVVLALARRRR